MCSFLSDIFCVFNKKKNMEPNAIVNINDGQIKGFQSENIDGGKFYSFLGIPYAKPPIGDRRFKAPEPVEPWNGILDATKEGEACYQRDNLTFQSFGSEACLHLNVYTKILQSEKQQLKPVMVWIHGGGFVFGSNSRDLFGPEFLLTEDVVLVVINYRLGFLGFLHFNDPNLDIPGNAGLKDQRLALQWVQNNIKHFNGDPNNVTIFGESAGAASVHYQVLSSSTKGLFHKAIIQSGSVYCPWASSGDVGLKFAQTINGDIKNEKEAADLLKNLSVEELQRHQENFCKINGEWGIAAPNVEYPNKTAFITEAPHKLIVSGQYNKVPILMGLTNREGLLFQAGGFSPENVDLSNFIPPHLNLEKSDPKRLEIVKKYQEFYFQGENSKDTVMFSSDYNFNSGIVAAALNHVKTSPNPLYFYQMTVDAGLNFFKIVTKQEHEKGASHADDLGYLFNAYILKDKVTRGPFEDKVVRWFVKLWTNFARTGNPTPSASNLGVIWEPLREKELNYLEIGKELTMKKDLDRERIEFWRNIFKLSPHTADYL